MTPDISKLQLHELEELQSDIAKRIHDLEYQAWKAKKHTKEEIVKMFTSFGYAVPQGAKIWRVQPRGCRKFFRPLVVRRNHCMSKLREQVIINAFKRIFRKYSHLGPLKVVHLLRIAWEKEIGYENTGNIGRH